MWASGKPTQLFLSFLGLLKVRKGKKGKIEQKGRKTYGLFYAQSVFWNKSYFTFKDYERRVSLLKDSITFERPG